MFINDLIPTNPYNNDLIFKNNNSNKSFSISTFH